MGKYNISMVTHGLKDEVGQILKHKEKTRESDEALYYWLLKTYHKDPRDISAAELLRFVADGELPSFKTVVRLRRKMQEEFPKLRGNNARARKKAAKRVQQELGYNA